MAADLTLVVSTYNRTERILDFVRALQKEDLTGIEIQIIDNGSKAPNEQLDVEVNKLPTAHLVRRERNCVCVHCGKSLISLANSAFVLNPGDDDEIVPGSLQKLRKLIMQDPNFDVLITAMNVVNQSGKKTGQNFPLSENLINAPELLLARLLMENRIAWPSTLFRPEMFMKLSDWNFKYRTTLDWAFWILNAPSMRIAITDLPVVQYVRHEKNESAVVSANQQLYESVSMRIRVLSNRDLRAYLASLTDSQADNLMHFIADNSGLAANWDTNRILITLLVQSFSEENQRNWEAYLLGLDMIPWDATSFEITHHGKGKVENYWLGYPYSLEIDESSCLVRYKESLMNQWGYVKFNKAQTLKFFCSCCNPQISFSVVIECSQLELLTLEEMSFLLLQKASERFKGIENLTPAGFELKLLQYYRKLKSLFPLKLLIQLQKSRTR